MSRKNKKQEKETTIENFYDLRQEAVDDLVEALKTGESDKEVSTNIADITGEDTGAKRGTKKAEFNPYKRDFLAKIPVWLKAVFIKWWFAGCVCYFVIMGLGYYIGSDVDLWFLTALVYGIIVDIMVNPIFRFMESPEKEYDKYMMFPFPFKAFWTFFTNIIYYFLVMFIVNLITNAINLAIQAAGGTFAVYLNPLLFATLTLGVDMAFIGLKDLLVWLIRKNKRKKALAEGELQAETDAAFGVNSANSEGRGAPAATGGAEGDVSAAAADIGQPQAEIDEVEKLRRLAESRNNAADKNAVKKNKKK